MKKNNLEKCSHPVPSNSLGIIAMHCDDNIPISAERLSPLFNGPMTLVANEVSIEITRTEIVDKL